MFKVPIIMITGIGRSGTKFLSLLLNTAKNGKIYHETKGVDMTFFSKSYYDENMPFYLDRFQIMQNRMEEFPNHIYGEVNGQLRYWGNGLKIITPYYYQLVRDGRDVIRSLANRDPEIFSIHDKKETGKIHPLNNTSWEKDWNDFDQFSRLCWQWQDCTLRLHQQEFPFIRLEDILKGFESLQPLLKQTGLNLTYYDWKLSHLKKINATKEDSYFPHWKDWTEKQTKRFEEICGKAMRTFGYEI